MNLSQTINELINGLGYLYVHSLQELHIYKTRKNWSKKPNSNKSKKNKTKTNGLEIFNVKTTIQTRENRLLEYWLAHFEKEITRPKTGNRHFFEVGPRMQFFFEIPINFLHVDFQ